MQKGGKVKPIRKPQQQGKPGSQQEMQPAPVMDRPEKTNKLEGKIAIITGGDSGIGAAVAILFAKHGANVAISFLNESNDAKDIQSKIKNEYGKECLLLQGDMRKEKFCQKI